MDTTLLIKVADFGLAGRILSKDYLRLDKDAGIKLPVKWMAPESLSELIFSQKSDVVCQQPCVLLIVSNYTLLLLLINIIVQWSYGITCWEIFSCGESPYPGVQPSDLLTYLTNENRLKKPHNAHCSDEM